MEHNAEYWTKYLIERGIVQWKDSEEVERAFLRYMEWLRSKWVKDTDNELKDYENGVSK